jgi:3-mercaptopyruvate sulfurtransferase SseA
MSLLREFFLLGILVLAGAIVSLFLGWASHPWHGLPIKPGEIRAEDVRGLDVLWLDARPESAYVKAHIKSALWFNPEDPQAALLLAADAWLTDPKPIVIYCASESCATSGELAEWLRIQLPDAEIYNLQGGWAAWQKSE